MLLSSLLNGLVFGIRPVTGIPTHKQWKYIYILKSKMEKKRCIPRTGWTVNISSQPEREWNKFVFHFDVWTNNEKQRKNEKWAQLKRKDYRQLFSFYFVINLFCSLSPFSSFQNIRICSIDNQRIYAQLYGTPEWPMAIGTSIPSNLSKIHKHVCIAFDFFPP